MNIQIILNKCDYYMEKILHIKEIITKSDNLIRLNSYGVFARNYNTQQGNKYYWEWYFENCKY